MLGRRLRASALRRCLACLAFVSFLLVVGPTTAASAHAQLEWTRPVDSSVVLVPPRQVIVHFEEPVEVDFGSLRVVGSNSRRVDVGGAYHPSGDRDSVAVDLPGHLSRGTYVVAWRVVSDDSHPVHGVFFFSVGGAIGVGRARALVAALERSAGPSVVGTVFGVDRFVVFASLVIVVGLSMLLLFVWPEGRRATPARRLWMYSWTALLVGTVVGIALQGVSAAGLPLGDVARPSLLAQVLQTRFGWVAMARLGLLILLLPLHRRLASPAGDASQRGTRIVVSLLAAGLLMTPGLSGHASSGRQVVLGALTDFVHLAAVSLWIGGLIVLFVVLSMRAATNGVASRRLVARVSAISFVSVILIVASGTLQAFRQVGSWYAFVHTSYGAILIVKIALVVLLLLAAAMSRRVSQGDGWLPRRGSRRREQQERGGQEAPPLRTATLRRSVVVEMGLLAAVLAVTSLLVDAAPARQAAAQPFSASVPVLGVQLNVVVAPDRVGAGNQFHFYVLGELGQPIGIPELDASIRLPSDHLGPVDLPLLLGGPGHYAANAVDIPAAGQWELRVTVRTSSTDEQDLLFTLPVH